MKLVVQILLAASSLALLGCGGSGLKYSKTPTSNMQFVSCGAYAERGMSVEFKCLVRFIDLSDRDYLLTAVFSSPQDEYLPKQVVTEFRGPIPSITISATDFKRLAASGIHHVKMNLSTADNPTKIISHFDKGFLFSKIDAKLAKSMNLDTEVVGGSSDSEVSSRLPGR